LYKIKIFTNFHRSKSPYRYENNFFKQQKVSFKLLRFSVRGSGQGARGGNGVRSLPQVSCRKHATKNETRNQSFCPPPKKKKKKRTFSGYNAHSSAYNAILRVTGLVECLFTSIITRTRIRNSCTRSSTYLTRTHARTVRYVRELEQKGLVLILQRYVSVSLVRPS
jgi:hypothetical protein